MFYAATFGVFENCSDHRVGRKEHDFNLSVVPVERGDPDAHEARRRDIRKRSLARWGTRRSEATPPPPALAPEEPQRAAAPPTPKVGEALPVPAREEAAPPPKKPAEPNAPRKAVASTQTEGEARRPPVAAEPRRPGKGGPSTRTSRNSSSGGGWSAASGRRRGADPRRPESLTLPCTGVTSGRLRDQRHDTPGSTRSETSRSALRPASRLSPSCRSRRRGFEKLDKLLTRRLPPTGSRVHLFTPEELLAWLAGQPT